MKKIIFAIIFSLILPVIFGGHVYADEKITLSTYYPAPYGEYRTLSVGDTYAAPDPAGNANLLVEGRVGIGTTDPQALLHIRSLDLNPPIGVDPRDVNDDGSIDAIDVQLIINASLGIDISPFNADVNGDGSINAVDVQMVINGALGLPFARDNTVVLEVDRVGIGTTDPANRLDISSDTSAISLPLTINNAFVNAAIRIGSGINFAHNNNTLGNVVARQETAGSDNNTQLLFYNKAAGILTPNVIIAANGNVGIGTTTPNNRIQVHDFINFDDTGDVQLTALGFQAGNANVNTGSLGNKGTENVFIGYQAGLENTSGKYNTFAGWQAGKANTTGDSNLALGRVAFNYNTTGSNNVALGSYALYSNTTGEENVAVGYLAGNANTAGSSNVYVGHAAGLFENGTSNVFVGKYAGLNATGGGNVFLGYKAGYNELGSNKLYIANSETSTPLIYGDFSTSRVGLGTTNPQGKLDVNGTIYQRGSVLHADYVFEPGYKLETIDEHANFMWREKRLKAIPVSVIENGQDVVEIGGRSKGILEELEKAHIYIAQMNEKLKKLETQNAELEQKVERLGKKVHK